MSLRPMYDNIVVKPVKADEKTEGGIYLSNPDRGEQCSTGEVVSVGDGYRVNETIVPLKVAVGDVVYYRKGTEVTVKDDNGDDVLLVSEGAVIAIK